MNGELFDRRVRLQVEDLLFTDLRISFTVEKTSGAEPNKAKVSIYNLSADTRGRLSLLKHARVTLEAGFPENLALLFSGDTRRGPSGIQSEKSGTEWVTRLECGDGETAIRDARFIGSFGRGTSVVDVARAIAKELGVGMGNLEEALAAGAFRQGLQSFSGGFSARGKASTELNRLLTSLGLESSIQDGKLQVLKPGETLKGQAVLLSNQLRNIIGSPAINSAEKQDGPPTMKVRTPLQPMLRPGVQVKVESDQVQGYFKVKAVVHSGDTHGGDWVSECNCLAV